MDRLPKTDYYSRSKESKVTKWRSCLTLTILISLLTGPFLFLPVGSMQVQQETAGVGPPYSPGNRTLPILSFSPDVVISSTVTSLGTMVTNPSSNPYFINSITIIVPNANWMFSGTPTCGNAFLRTVTAYSSNAIECSGSLPPGVSEVLNIGSILPPLSPATSSAVSGNFTTLYADSGSNTAVYEDNPLTLYDISPTSIQISIDPRVQNTVTNYIAGTEPYLVSATLSSGQQGVPMDFTFSNPNYPSMANYSASMNPSLGFSNATGTTTSVFTPSNHAGDSTNLVASIANSTVLTATLASSIITQAGAPSKVIIQSINSSTNAYAVSSHYLTNEGTTIGTINDQMFTGAVAAKTDVRYVVTDSYSNPVSLDTISQLSISITATGGGLFDGDSPDSLVPVVKCGIGAVGVTFSCPNGQTYNALPFNYFQSSLYGYVGLISITIIGAGIDITGTSGKLITGLLSTVGQIKADSPAILATNRGDTLPNIRAGDILNVSVSLPINQAGVPITLSICQKDEMDGSGVNCNTNTNATGTFSTGASNILLTSINSPSSSAFALFNASTISGSTVSFVYSLSVQDDSGVKGIKVNSSQSESIHIIAGPASKLKVSLFSAYGNPASSSTDDIITNGRVLNGSSVYVNVAFADAYGNVAPAPTISYLITLQPSSGSVSVTTISGGSGCVDTQCSIGLVAWYLPNVVGDVSTLTASAEINGTFVSSDYLVTTVSASPLISIQPSGEKVIYSDNPEILVQGLANVSSGFPRSPAHSNPNTITKLAYRVGIKGAWTDIPIVQGQDESWSLSLILPQGMSLVYFNLTDSLGNEASISQEYLMDASHMNVTTPMVVGTNITLNIIDAEGDINSSSIKAWLNGTVVPSSSLIISGSEIEGNYSSFSLTLVSLGAGKWNVTVSAADFSGDSATTKANVLVSYPQDDTFSLNITSLSLLGPYHIINASVISHSPTTQIVYVIAVVQDSLGQIVSVSTATVALPPEGTTFAEPILNVGTGSYKVQLFIWSTSGISLSQTQTMNVTIA